MRMGLLAKVIIIVALFSIPAFAEDTMSARDIIDKSYDHNVMDFKAATADMKMDLIKGSEVQEVRKLRAKAIKVEEGKESLRRVLLTFVEPDDVAGTAFLSLERPGDADDDQFLYLPALKKTLRKGGKSGKGESFMGTQFTFGDLESKDVDKADHKRLPDEKLGDVDCYVIESIPKNPKDEQYSKYITWVNKKTFIPQKVRLFDLKGKQEKIALTEKVEVINGTDTITQITMLNTQTKKATRLYLTNIDNKAKLDEADFTKERITKL